MNDKTIVYFAAAAFFGLMAVGFAYVALNTQIQEVTITSGNSWQGGDLQTYFNATAVFNGHVISHVFPCDYYKVGDKIQVSWAPLVGYSWYTNAQGCY